jgi:phosphoenolpyruvate carboxylase
MRRDVRLLGDLLGDVIRESGQAGPELLADVEQLRQAVIEARLSKQSERKGDEIAALVASWGLDRAEQVARAFTVYFHLVNLAEEHQRIRILRERDDGSQPVRESLAAAVAELRQHGEQVHPENLSVHLVLTAHPTEARRRAVVAALRRISELLQLVDDDRQGATDRTEALRSLKEQIDLLWRTSQLRVKAMDPIDEVRTVMTAFDETLFRVVPFVYS